MSGRIGLGPGAEFDAIRQMLDRWGSRAVGIGDDAATVRVARGDALVVSVDSAVEGRHFRPEWLTAREIGYRAVAAALSDLAAMAARPLGVLIAIVAPANWRKRLVELADGIGDMVELAQTQICGGNLSDGGELSITTTVLGEAFSPLSRAGATVGNRVYVTGRLGGSAAALARLKAGKPAGAYRDRFARPVPRVAESHWLANAGASAAIDVSDGLLADVGHLAAASNVGIELVASRIPLFHVGDNDVAVERVDLEAALHGGEEYELVVTSSSDFDVDEFERRFRIPLTEIGRVTDAEHGIVYLSGARVANARGHDHFTR
jgi:thiamine-monophosphate kinase